MRQYITRRLLLTIPTLIFVSVVIFALMRVVPGDAAMLRVFGGENAAADPAAYQALTAKQVKDVFAKHGVPANAVVVVVSPKAAGAAGGPGAGMDPGSGR